MAARKVAGKVARKKPSKKAAAPARSAAKPKAATSKPKIAASKPKVAAAKPKIAAAKPKVALARPRSAAARPAAPRAAGKLVPGAKAPAFALKDQSGRTVRTSDFAGRKLLVYFYPKADTPGCTVQSCSVRDHRKSLNGLGVDVVGISPDAPKAQAKFDTKYGLGFPLLADEDHAVAEAFGAWGEKSMYGRKYMGIVRSSFLIDESGRIAQAWYGVKPDETVPNARAAL